MDKLVCLIAILNCLFFPCALSAQTAPSLTLSDEQGYYKLGSHLELMEDPSNTLTIYDASSSRFTSRFTPSTSSAPQIGFTKSTWWGRFTIHNVSRTRDKWILHLDYPLMDRIDLYLPCGEGKFAARHSGRSLPFFVKELKRKDHLFLLPLTSDNEQTFYLRIVSESFVSLPLAIWDRDSFEVMDRSEHLSLGIFFGIILVMSMYNLFLFVSLRDRAYLFYALYALLVAFTQFIVEGLALQYLWPYFPDMNRTIEIVATFLSLSLAVSFSRSFLQTARFLPTQNRLLAFIQWGFSAFALMSPLFRYSYSVKVLSLCVLMYAPVLIYCGVASRRTGFRSANFFLVSWIWTLASSLMIVLNSMMFHLLGSDAILLYRVSFVIEIVLLSLALADRINILQREKLNGQEENSRLAMKNRQQQMAARSREVQYSNERERMLQDLHDGIGGITANISILSDVTGRSSDESDYRRSLEVIASLSRVCTNEIRMFINSLDPDELSWPSLSAEMKFYGLSMTESHGIALSFVASGLTEQIVQPCSVIYLNILRIYKEIIANIVKHASAQFVEISLALETDLLTLVVKDDGIGIPEGKLSGRGITHMKMRTGKLGGSFSLDAGNGTRISIVIPIPLKYPSAGMVDEISP
jgi:signal transduction histidine kinase